MAIVVVMMMLTMIRGMVKVMMVMKTTMTIIMTMVIIIMIIITIMMIKTIVERVDGKREGERVVILSYNFFKLNSPLHVRYKFHYTNMIK